MFTFDITKTPSGNVFNIFWKVEPIPIQAYKELIKSLSTHTWYSPITALTIKKLSHDIKNINSKYGIKLTVDHAISLHHIVSKDKIMRDYPRLNSLAKKITAEYNLPTDILKLAIKYNFPPVNLLRTIFINNGYDQSALFTAFGGEPHKVLKGRDLKQLLKAEKNDADSRISQEANFKRAMDFESIVVKEFTKIGIKIKLQEDLVKEQTIQFGRPILTPDILFLDTVYINGEKVKWLDCKNYLGNDIDFIYKSNVKQAAKYSAEWGLGIILYRYSFKEDLKIPGAILLNY
jgi:hypothetical protein